MKQAILATAVALAGFLPVPALRAQTTDPVSQRLMQIDLDVATRHYEKLQGMLRDSRLEQLVNDGSLGENHPARAALQRKIAILEQLTDETRSEILKLGQALVETGATVSPYTRGKNAPVTGAPTASATTPVPGITAVDPGLVPPSAGIPGGSGSPLPTPNTPVEPPQPLKPALPGAPPVDYPIAPKPMPVAPAVSGATGAGGNSRYPAPTPPPVALPPADPAR